MMGTCQPRTPPPHSYAPAAIPLLCGRQDANKSQCNLKQALLSVPQSVGCTPEAPSSQCSWCNRVQPYSDPHLQGTGRLNIYKVFGHGMTCMEEYKKRNCTSPMKTLGYSSSFSSTLPSASVIRSTFFTSTYRGAAYLQHRNRPKHISLVCRKGVAFTIGMGGWGTTVDKQQLYHWLLVHESVRDCAVQP